MEGKIWTYKNTTLSNLGHLLFWFSLWGHWRRNKWITGTMYKVVLCYSKNRNLLVSLICSSFSCMGECLRMQEKKGANHGIHDIYIHIYYFTPLRFFHISTGRWFLAGVWVTPSLLKSPGPFSVFSRSHYCNSSDYYYYYYLLIRVFRNSFSWLSFTGVWVTASLLDSCQYSGRSQ